MLVEWMSLPKKVVGGGDTSCFAIDGRSNYQRRPWSLNLYHFFANWRLQLNAGAAPLAAHQNNDISWIGWLRLLTARYGVFSCVQLRKKTLHSKCKQKRWHIRSKTSIKIGLHWVLKNQIESVESKQRRRRRSRMTCTFFLHLEMRLSAISK